MKNLNIISNVVLCHMCLGVSCNITSEVMERIQWMVVEMVPEVSHTLPTVVFPSCHIWATTTSPECLPLLSLSLGYHYQNLYERQLERNIGKYSGRVER